MKKHVILFLAANPSRSSQLALDQECAAIERELRMTSHRDDFEFRSKWAVTVDDLMRHLGELQPSIIHFSGHGAGIAAGGSSATTRDAVAPGHSADGQSGIYLQDDQGGAQLVTARGLTMMIRSAAASTRVVVLNACYSESQADAVRSVVDCVVGMAGAIGDDAARSFAVSFYRALGNRRSVGNAVEQAWATLDAKGMPDEVRPRCVTRNGIDKHRVSLEARRAVGVRERRSSVTKPSKGARAPAEIAHGSDEPSLAAGTPPPSRLMFVRAGRAKVSELPLPQFFVWWNDLTRGNITRFQRQLAQATREQDMQSFLEREPMMLVQHLGGGHGRWVIPWKRLGAEHVTDFIIGEQNSAGWAWQAVELESPRARMFTKKGDQTPQLAHAIRQIQDWRAWLMKNATYAAAASEQHGLGLTDIRSDLPGLVLIGRRASADPATNSRRRQMEAEHNIQFHTYDFLLDNARGRIGYAIACRKRRRQGRASANHGGR